MSFLANVSACNLLEVTIGVDPGLGGAVAALLGDTPIVWPTPIILSKVRKRTKTKGMHDVAQKNFDLEGMLKLLRQFQVSNSSVVFAIEKVGVMGHDSKVAAFSFGEGYGYWKMAAVACGFKLIEISPQEWKKFYPELLETPEITALRESIKVLKTQLKDTKDKKQSQGIKKDISNQNRQLKGHAKDAARNYAATLYPDLADSFKLKKDDGKAESILLARYAKAHYR